jgi:hypothetical protein
LRDEFASLEGRDCTVGLVMEEIVIDGVPACALVLVTHRPQMV